MKTEKPNKETLDKWHSDASNWKLYVFYYNKKDRRIFPPKRFKSFGWTVNFANPYSCLAFVAIIILGIAIIKYFKNH